METRHSAVIFLIMLGILAPKGANVKICGDLTSPVDNVAGGPYPNH